MPRKKHASDKLLDYHSLNINITVSAKNHEQKNMMKTVENNMITFVKGPPGCGKTYVAVSLAMQKLFRSNYAKVLFSRPAIEAAGENLGFLPGDIQDKIDPYMIPIFDVLSDYLSSSQIQRLISNNDMDSIVRVMPLAFMRGVTFKNSFCVVDEAQNTTPEQMRMLLTRIGEKSKLVICGDVRQSDVKIINGLQDAFDLLQGVEGVGFVDFTNKSIIRHPIIAEIEDRYEYRIKPEEEQ
jgi:phosphate starvation-inducible protein PhoH and related proteins